MNRTALATGLDQAFVGYDPALTPGHGLRGGVAAFAIRSLNQAQSRVSREPMLPDSSPLTHAERRRKGFWRTTTPKVVKIGTKRG